MCVLPTGEEIKKKWRNIRDTYAKELVNQKKARKGKMKRKRPYRYTEQLSFLSAQFMEKESKDSSSESNDDDDDDDTDLRRKSNKLNKYSVNLSSNIVIDVGTLIREVKSRPILWNRRSQLSERNERDMRDKLWDEICEIIFENWADLGSAAKSLRCKLKVQ